MALLHAIVYAVVELNVTEFCRANQPLLLFYKAAAFRYQSNRTFHSSSEI
jgi:hypothetical protein